MLTLHHTLQDLRQPSHQYFDNELVDTTHQANRFEVLNTRCSCDFGYKNKERGIQTSDKGLRLIKFIKHLDNVPLNHMLEILEKVHVETIRPRRASLYLTPLGVLNQS